MANVKKVVAAHLSQRQRQINKQVERTDLLDQDRLLCQIIRVSGNINVPGRPGFIWCQEYSPSNDTNPFHAFNNKVQAREGLDVWIGAGLGGRREVLDWNNATIVNTSDYNAQKYLPTHHSDHEWPDFKPGPDVVNVYPRSLSMLRTYPGEAGALTVSCSPLRYIKSNALVLFPGKNSLDISAAQPASGLVRFVGIYLDPDDNTLKSVNGATTGDSPVIIPDNPSFPESAILSANVRLDGDQTTFSEVDIVDVRQILDSSGAIDGTRISKLVSPDGLTDPVLSVDNNGDTTAVGAISADSFSFVVENTSGAAVSANEIGYIDEAGEFQTTTTQFLDVDWCVVIIGGANNADIHVARRGRVTIELDGNNSIGDLLYTSTTAGQANPQSYMRPEAFAIALTANASGAGGTCSALLLTQTRVQPVAYTENLYVSVALSDSDFDGTIATLPGGAVLTYTPVTADELNLVPGGTGNIAKIRLFNSTRSTYGLIENSVAATNTITLTAAVDAGWQVGDTITIRSQTNTSSLAGPTFFFDFEIEDTVEIPTLARAIEGQIAHRDSGAAQETARTHPWETNSSAKRRVSNSNVANQLLYTRFFITLIQRRFVMQWTASGAGTATVQMRPDIVYLASP